LAVTAKHRVQTHRFRAVFLLDEVIIEQESLRVSSIYRPFVLCLTISVPCGVWHILVFLSCKCISVWTFRYLQNKEVNTLWTGDEDLRLYVTTVQDG